MTALKIFLFLSTLVENNVIQCLGFALVNTADLANHTVMIFAVLVANETVPIRYKDPCGTDHFELSRK